MASLKRYYKEGTVRKPNPRNGSGIVTRKTNRPETEASGIGASLAAVTPKVQGQQRGMKTVDSGVRTRYL